MTGDITGGLTVEPVDPSVCVANGYEYKEHRPWLGEYPWCDRCGRQLAGAEGTEGERRTQAP